MRRPSPNRHAALLTALALSGTAAAAHAQNATTPDQLVTDPPTLHALGFAWFITGDDNRNCSVTVQYREAGQSNWRDAMPLFRVENRLISGDVHPGNLLAGSIFGLTADTEYDVQLTLSDPDGGSDQQTVTAHTRPVPPPTDLSAPQYVAPGSGGGSGTQGDPYLGLAAADAVAQPGDVFLLTAGTYQGHSFSSDGAPGSPITYRGETQDGVVIDGGSTSDIVINIGSRRHLVLENFTLRNAQRALIGADTEGIVIRHLQMDNIQRFVSDRDPFAIMLTGDSRDSYVCDNTLTGPVDWQSQEYGPDSFGIKVSGSGHVVCHNAITAFWDDIGMANGSEGNYGIAIDIYRNVLLDSSDDSIETDYGQRNIRVWRNQLANSLKGISCQPVYGGPVYLLRNEMFNTRSSPYKFHVNPSGMLILHNSTAAFERAFAGGEWSNAIFRNNLFYGSSGYSMETVGQLEDFDYNGWAPKQTPVLKFNDIRYDTINASCGTSDPDDWCAQTGHSEHAIQIDRADWVDVPEPAAYATHPTPGNWNFELADGSGAIDSAEPLANVNDGFEGSGPDRGALERGAPRPHYGPRDDWEDPGSGTGGTGAAAGAGGAGATGQGGSSTGGTGSGATGADGSGANAAAVSEDDGGCGCRMRPVRTVSAAWLLALGLALARRRRLG